LRGSPLEAPENTLASLTRALDLDLDGLAYDVRACASGEPVLLRDATLDRTTDGRGPLAERTLPEISLLDAGGWFGARFQGEPLLLLEEALEIAGDEHRARPVHVLWLRERGLVPEVARALRRLPREQAVRVASTSREVCLEARDAGLTPMLLVHEASEEARDYVRAHRIAACATDAFGWRTSAGAADWTCERWSLGLDSPADLLEACRAPITGLATREPLRALSIRALVVLAPSDTGPYPLQVPELEVRPGDLTGGRGDWCGSWACTAGVRNPFPFRVEISAGIVPRHGAFETEGVPRRFALEAGGETLVSFRITGGSWRPGGDPLFFALYRWRRGSGRRAGALLLDAALARVRTAVADGVARRLTMLREAPGDAAASMVLRRRGRQLFVSIENAAGLEQPRTIVHLDGRFHHGGRGLRAALPEDFDSRRKGVAFSCGFEARLDGGRIVRRWAGGVPDEDGAGSPGRILPRSSA
jgi:hypothetical protein